MSIRNMRGKWQWRFQHCGQNYAGTTALRAIERNRRRAEAEEAAARAKVLAGQSGLLTVKSCPFSEALDRWLTWADGEHREHPATARRKRTSAASLRAFFDSRQISAISPGLIEDYKAWRRTSGVKDVTLRHDLHALSGFLRYCRKQRWLIGDPLQDVEIPSDRDAVRIYVVSPDEEARYFAACRDLGYGDLYDLARLMLNQGCRPQELLALEQDAVHLLGGTLEIRQGKTSAARRTLALTPESRSLLAARLAVPSKWVFPSPRIAGRHMERAEKPHNAVLKALGYPEGQGWVMYAFRHTFASRAAARGMPLATLARILGHSGLRTVLRYVHIDQQAMDEAMVKFGPAVASTVATPEPQPTAGQILQ